MKKITGICAIVIGVACIVLGVLELWDIRPIAWSLVLKIVVSVAVALALTQIVRLLWHLFFRREKADRTSGNQAHPMK